MSRRPFAVAVMLAVVLSVFATTGCRGETGDRPGEPLASYDAAVPFIELAPSPGSGGETEVTGRGFTGSKVTLFQCAARADDQTGIDVAAVCDMTLRAARVIDVDATGALRTEFPLEPVIGVGQRHEVDCLARPCVLAVAGPDDEVIALTEVSWPDDFVALPAPRLTISDVVFDDRGAGRATVSGKHYLPGQGIRLAQCPAAGSASSPDVVAGECNYDAGARFKADANGSFSGVVELVWTLSTGASGSIDCVTAPASCAVADPWPRHGRMSRVLLG